MIAKDPAVARAIRATAFTPMPLTGRSVLPLSPRGRRRQTSAGGMEAAGRWRRRESNPRRRSASDESQEDPDLARADAGESASSEGHKREAASAAELPFIHPGQLSVFDRLGDG
jgi:hypothetical protein